MSRASFVEALESRRLLSGTISGRLYIDLNGNGEYDYTVEPTADNFSVVAVGQSGTVQVYTSSNGEFIIYDVPAGEYLVKADAREGFTPGDSRVKLVVDNTGNFVGNIGITPTGPQNTITINLRDSGGDPIPELPLVYMDANRNGRRDDGEWTRTTNGFDGNVVFQGVAGGDYLFRMDVQLGWGTGYVLSGPPGALEAGGAEVSVSANGGDAKSATLNYTKMATVSGKLYFDNNSNDIFDGGDEGVAGIAVYVDENNNNQRDAGEAFSGTNENGEYSISNVMPGQKKLRIERTANVMAAAVDVTLAEGEAATQDIIAKVPLGRLSGKVFTDANGNDAQDDGEPSVAGLVIYLDSNNDGKRGVNEPFRITDADGKYEFTSLTGHYVVRPWLSSKHTFTFGAVGSYTHTVTLEDAFDDLNFSIGESTPTLARNDFNNDGQADVLVRNPNTGQNVLWLMDGSTRTSVVALPTLDPKWSVAAISDFNNDGHVDILWHNNQSRENWLWTMNGTTRIFSEKTSLVAGAQWKLAGSGGDWNNDGYDDLVWYNASTGAALLWHMVGLNLHPTEGINSLGVVKDLNWQLQDVADINQDGRLDLLWANPSAKKMVLWDMQKGQAGWSPAIRSIPYPAASDWRFLGTGNFNESGPLELLWQNSYAKTSVWTLSGLDGPILGWVGVQYSTLTFA